ncbi:Hypothetical predicted protein, partial [Paramuricea clavata]
MPGELTLPADEVNLDIFSRKLSDAIRAQCFRRPEWHSTEERIAGHVPQQLKSCSHVFVREERNLGSLRPKYHGPFPVVARSEKTVTITRDELPEVISLDR